MKLDIELTNSDIQRNSIITVGVFDGVHLGHHQIISHLLSRASKTGLLPGVVTFIEHPSSVLNPDFPLLYITSLEDRIHLIKEMGIDIIIPVTFDIELSRLSARDFVLYLKKHLLMRELVVGPNSTLGSNRKGTFEVLQSIGDSSNFTVTTTTMINNDHQPISSTQIRTALLQGDMNCTTKLLGRNFSITGKVVRGDGRGKLLGFPTANVALPPKMITPADGIYATLAFVDQNCFMAATSIGTRPTFNGEHRTIEAHIIDWEFDLYDREIRLDFVQRLRDEVKYTNIETLQRQMHKDVEKTKKILQSG